jgi:hypothetical protein
MTLVRDVVAEARRQFMTSQRDRYNTLGADITSSALTLSVSYDTGAQAQTAIIAGSVIEIDLESMLVTDVSTLTLTVIRGFNGSAKKAHTAGTLVKVNPVLLDLDLFVALNRELQGLSAPQNGLYQVNTYEFTPSGDVGYDLPLPLRGVAPILDVFAVRWQEPRGFWPRVYGWRFDRKANITDFASGMSLEFKQGVEGAGRLHRAWYKAGFAPVESLSDDLESVSGLPDTAVDIAVYGAALRAANPREIGRNLYERQGDTRRAAEVPVGAQLQSGTVLRAEYKMRVSAERSRLHRDWKFLPA